MFLHTMRMQRMVIAQLSVCFVAKPIRISYAADIHCTLALIFLYFAMEM